MDSGLIVSAIAIEIVYAGLVSAAAGAFFRHQGHTVAEAGAYGLMAMLMLHCWLAQVLLFTGLPGLFMWFQLPAAAAAGWVIRRYHRPLADQYVSLRRFARAHWAPVGSMSAAWVYLSAVWVWKTGLAHIPAAQAGTDFWNPAFLWTASATGDFALPVLNQAVWMAPWQSAFAPGVANFGAYIAIALATYALARRYAWPPTAITVSLLVVSMPRLAHQSLSAGSELLPAAAALVAVLALYRLLEEPHARDAGMLVCTISFSVAGGRLCYAMPSVLAALSLLILARRHDIRLWPQAIRSHPQVTVISAAALLIFSQILTVAVNLEAGNPWMGDATVDTLAFNTDRLSGAAANLVRYMLLTIHFPEILDRFGQWAFGVSGLAGLKLFYQSVIAPVAGDKGAAVAFDLSWGSANGGGWFGPVGFLLVMPSLVNAFRRGPDRLKMTAFALASYWVLVALVAAWQPSNVRMMTPFFVVSGFTMAFFLPPWRLGRKGRLMLQLFGIMMLAGDMFM
jgi:hypothetical protein